MLQTCNTAALEVMLGITLLHRCVLCRYIENHAISSAVGLSGLKSLKSGDLRGHFKILEDRTYLQFKAIGTKSAKFSSQLTGTTRLIGFSKKQQKRLLLDPTSFRSVKKSPEHLKQLTKGKATKRPSIAGTHQDKNKLVPVLRQRGPQTTGRIFDKSSIYTQYLRDIPAMYLFSAIIVYGRQSKFCVCHYRQL